MERTRVELATSALRTQEFGVLSETLPDVASIAEPQRTNERTSSPENDHGEAVQDSVPIKADSFSAALAMIASLPLSDAEKADAVRRLMAERAG